MARERRSSIGRAGCAPQPVMVATWISSSAAQRAEVVQTACCSSPALAWWRCRLRACCGRVRRFRASTVAAATRPPGPIAMTASKPPGLSPRAGAVSRLRGPADQRRRGADLGWCRRRRHDDLGRRRRRGDPVERRGVDRQAGQNLRNYAGVSPFRKLPGAPRWAGFPYYRSAVRLDTPQLDRRSEIFLTKMGHPAFPRNRVARPADGHRDIGEIPFQSLRLIDDTGAVRSDAGLFVGQKIRRHAAKDSTNRAKTAGNGDSRSGPSVKSGAITPPLFACIG